MEIYDNGCTPYTETEVEVWLNLSDRIHEPSPKQMAELPAGVQPLGKLIMQAMMAA
jgi:hypothetical protein